MTYNRADQVYPVLRMHSFLLINGACRILELTGVRPMQVTCAQAWAGAGPGGHKWYWQVNSTQSARGKAQA